MWLREKRIACYSVGEIEEYFNEDSDRLRTKRGIELLTGCILEVRLGGYWLHSRRRANSPWQFQSKVRNSETFFG